MTPQECQELLPGVREAALEAGAAILSRYRASYEVYDKEDQSPVTTADFEAHHIVAKHLCTLAPHLPVLSEESALVPWEERREWMTYWLVDPLDGTREFLARNGQFTVNISLIHLHRPVLGVVHAPVQDQLYYAHKGGGAYRIEDNGAPCKISTRPLPECVAVAVGHHSGTQVRSLLERIPNREEHRIGSSLKSCRVAEGEIDLYPRHGPTHEWDTAAAQCIVEEAGGGVLDWNLEPLHYNRGAGIRNPSFLIIGDPKAGWEQLLEGLRARDPE